MKAPYGFSRPYDFTRAVPFLLACTLVVLISLVWAIFAAARGVEWNSYRLFYFCYLVTLAALAAALSVRPRIAWTLIVVCAFELLLGVASLVFYNLGLWKADYLLPEDRAVVWKQRAVYHPLLQVIPPPHLKLSSPVKTEHDSNGLRGPERDPARLRQQTVVAAVGGSTTYDLAVPDGKTWPEELERLLGPDYAVVNHGMAGYSTTEHVIQTAFYLNAYDVKPRCALYYIGWNDIRSAHVPDLDPGYAKFHLLTQVGGLGVRKIPFIAEVSPLARFAYGYLRDALDTIPVPDNYRDRPTQQGSDPRLEKIYAMHVELLAAINKDRGITSLFVGQLLNRAQLRKTSRDVWAPLVRQADIWPLQERFNAVLRETAQARGSPVLIPPIDDFVDADFADAGHFSIAGAAKFAAMVAPFVREHCSPGPSAR